MRSPEGRTLERVAHPALVRLPGAAVWGAKTHVGRSQPADLQPNRINAPHTPVQAEPNPRDLQPRRLDLLGGLIHEYAIHTAA
jgi:hypothetical protein